MNLTVYTARAIRTMNPSMPLATAVVVGDGRIVEVGTMESIRPWLDAHPHRIDHTFADKVLMPGFIDPHLHPSLGAIMLPMFFITALPWELPDRTVPATRGQQAYLAELTAIEAAMGDDEPLHTWGYHNLWHGPLDRRMLNDISTTRPIVVWQRSFHEIYLNDPGMEALGLDRDRLAGHPQVDLDAGRFFESGKFLATSRMIDYLTEPARFEHGLELTKQAVHAGGHTTIADLTGGYFDTEGEWDAMCNVLDNNTTPFRVQMIPTATRGVNGAAGLDGSMALVKERAKRSTEKLFYRNHVKLFADGAFFAQLMQVAEPGYIDGHHGEWMFPPEQFEELARRYWNEGYQIHVHCTGDLGLDLVLDVLAKLQWERPRFDHRFTVEHFGLSNPEQVRRLKELGAMVSANVYYVHELGEMYWQQSLGHERASQMARLGTLARHQVTTALHSDFTMAPAKPLTNAWVAVNRIGEGGTVLGPEERITVDAAMRAVTIDAAIILGMESDIGSIRAGKLADFTVLEQDPYEVEPEALADIPIWGTVFEGQPFPLGADQHAPESQP